MALKRKFLIFAIIFLFLLHGCGRKTSPLPIKKSLPQEAELSIEPTPFGINLWITLPEKTQGGYPLTKIKYVEIEKKEEPFEKEGKARTKKIKIKPKLHSAGRLLLFTDSEVKAGYRYTYRIKIKKDFLVESPFYEEKIIYWFDPPSGVRDLNFIVSPSDELILKWNPPLENLRGGPLLGELFYTIERVKTGKIEYLNIKETYFKEKISLNERICLRVRPVLYYYGTFIPGPFSEHICYP